MSVADSLEATDGQSALTSLVGWDCGIGTIAKVAPAQAPEDSVNIDNISGMILKSPEPTVPIATHPAISHESQS
jgi:hypothetical protein